MRVQIINDVIVAFGIGLATEISFPAPLDYSPDLYDYVPTTPGVYNINNFRLKPLVPQIDFSKRENNLRRMNEYMASFINNGLTQANFDLFLSDTSALQQQYLGGGGRLITWVETVNRNGYNASTIGFKTRTGYRGLSSNGVEGASGDYIRANTILAILNDL